MLCAIGCDVTFILACLTLACVVGTSTTSRAQIQRPVEQQNSDKIVISKDEVPFDVVVRDKKGRPIKDLTVSDFEVYEDGVRQEINSFRFVSSTAEDNRPTSTNNKDNSGSGNDSSVSDEKRTMILPNHLLVLWHLSLIDSPLSRAHVHERLLSATWVRVLRRASWSESFLRISQSCSSAIHQRRAARKVRHRKGRRTRFLSLYLEQRAGARC